MLSRVPAFFRNLAALQHMNWYCRLITNLKYLCKILIHYDPQASWIYFINVLLCSDFSRLVGCGGSIFYWDIRDLWSVYNTNSCIEVPQDSKKMLVTYCPLGYQHFSRIFWYFNTWIDMVDWSQISNISVKYWSTTNHEPAEITT